MRILHYRQTDCCEDPWEGAILNGQTDLNDYRCKTLISINGQRVVTQHQSSYITGRDTSHAHHFAKMLTAAVLKGDYGQAPSLSVTLPQNEPGDVLWVDSVRGLHACADFFDEMITNYDPEHKHFSLLCLDKLGSQRYEFYSLIYHIEDAVKKLKPALLIIDDIDHLMPYCGVNVATVFKHIIRDILNHTSTACLFIGYNHLGKRASTTGNLGNVLFTMADSVFSVTTQHAVSKVKLVRSYTVQSNYDAEFLFVVNNDNLPHEVVYSTNEKREKEYIQQNTLRDIIGEVVQPGETISPDELFGKLNARRLQLNRCNRTRALIAQATQLGIVHKSPDANTYTLTPVSPSHDSNDHSPDSPPDDPDTPINISLTLPPHPNHKIEEQKCGC